MMIKLSILVPTIPSRLSKFFTPLINDLLLQISDNSDIEIVGLFDNKKRSVGQKRNELLRMSQGEYLVFIDDDDGIAPDYISSIMNALQENPTADCVVYDCITTIDGDPNKRIYSKYSINYEYSKSRTQWRGKPAHTMVYRSEIAKKYLYKDTNFGEDIDWVIRACKEIKNEIRIDRVLYFYNFNSATTETRK